MINKLVLRWRHRKLVNLESFFIFRSSQFFLIVFQIKNESWNVMTVLTKRELTFYLIFWFIVEIKNLDTIHFNSCENAKAQTIYYDTRIAVWRLLITIPSTNTNRYYKIPFSYSNWNLFFSALTESTHYMQMCNNFSWMNKIQTFLVQLSDFIYTSL